MNDPIKNKVDYSVFGKIDSKPLSKIRQLIADHMVMSWTTVPHVTHHEDIDVSAIEILRHKLNTNHLNNKDKTTEVNSDVGVNKIHYTLLPFIAAATLKTLKSFPEFNASLDETGKSIILKHYFNLGIAVDTPNGLIVPVVKNADSMNFKELTIAIIDLANRARSEKLTFSDIEGGSFSITSLGANGGRSFTPIVNVPEVAILGISRENERVVVRNGVPAVCPMVTLSLSYDHRVIDGAMASNFMTQLRHLLEKPSALTT